MPANRLTLIACFDAEIPDQATGAEVRLLEEGHLQVDPRPQTAKGRERIISQRLVDVPSSLREIPFEYFLGECLFRSEMIGE